jgi:hypothetical protein
MATVTGKVMALRAMRIPDTVALIPPVAGMAAALMEAVSVTVVPRDPVAATVTRFKDKKLHARDRRKGRSFAL